jgi:glycosyltransferase involved in cell wall biosynthesis
VSDRRGSSTLPTISVLIPVRDGAAYLADAIESALDQSYRPLELIVVDDGSLDDTRSVASRFGSDLVYVRQDRRGQGSARNRALRCSTGELIAFLDADDLFEPGRLERQVAAFVDDPSLDAAFGRVAEFVEPSRSGPAPPLRRARPETPSYLVTAALIRRAALERIGPFATDLHVNVTVEWIARARDAGLRTVMLDDVVLRRRLHGANIGITNWDAGRELVQIARASLERRRSAATDRRQEPR